MATASYRFDARWAGFSRVGYSWGDGLIEDVNYLVGVWLTNDLKQSYDTALADRSYRSMHRCQTISQSFRTELLATDYVLRDVLGRPQVSDLVYPDPDPAHAQLMRCFTSLSGKGGTASPSLVRNCMTTGKAPRGGHRLGERDAPLD